MESFLRGGRTLFLLLSMSVAIPGISVAQIPNPGFEAWTAFNPNGWETTNELGVAAPITASDTRNSGQMAVREKCSSPSMLSGRRPVTPNSPRLSFPRVSNSIISLLRKGGTTSM